MDFLLQVNAANEQMLGGGGVDGGNWSEIFLPKIIKLIFLSLQSPFSAIHRAAGPELLEACSKVPEVLPGVRCPTGEARITQ